MFLCFQSFPLIFSQVQSSDAGTFVCIVEFEGGASLSFKTTLSVVDKPSGKTKQHSTAQLSKISLGMHTFFIRTLSFIYLFASTVYIHIDIGH